MHVFGIVPPHPSPSPDGWQPPSDPTLGYIWLLFLFGLMFLFTALAITNIIDWLDHRERLRRGRKPK